MHRLPIILCLLIFPLDSQSLLAVLPLRDQWRAGCRALSGADPVKALTLFREFDAWYGDEPEVRDPEFHEGRIRLWGLAALEAGEFGEAAALLERWLRENPDHERHRAFLRFQLLGLCQATGDTEGINRHRQAFLTDHPELPECALVRWSWADAAIAAGNYQLAREQLLTVLESSYLPASGVDLARAALALVELASGNSESALDTLQDDETDTSGEILRFWKALLAPSLTRQFLEEDNPQAANLVTAWFDGAASLKTMLAACRSPLEAKGRKPGSVGIRQSIWNSHWSAQLDRLDHSLDAQADSGDGTDGLYALRLHALLAAREARRTTVLADALLRSSRPLEAFLRAEAFKAFIEASLQLKEWERAEARIREFAGEYPDDPALPEIRFLSARTAAARSDWSEAVSQVERLLENYPEHSSRHNWALLRAGWLLQAGMAEQALAAFLDLAEATPSAWQPFLKFQCGRSLAALKQTEEAVARFTEVASMNDANSALRESACLEKLKLFLRHGDAAAFQSTLENYRTAFPDGQQQWFAENLAGTFLKAMGQPEEAIGVFSRIASSGHACASFARTEISDLYRQINDMENLRLHGLDWIRAGLKDGEFLPAQPFHDCLAWQLAASRPAMPDHLLQDLLEGLDAGAHGFAVTPFLDLLDNQWMEYRELIGSAETELLEWCEAMAARAYQASAWRAFAAYQLHAATSLEREGRLDSADARRIQVLQGVEPQLLSEPAAYIVASTARKYDFPEAGDLLSSFLRRFPESEERPSCLLQLATFQREKNSDDAREAASFLEEVVRDWPDAPVYWDAVLLLASWKLEDKAADEALPILANLLEDPALPPSDTARALLLRAEADFLVGQAERGFLDCFRIIQLYPDIHDASIPAFALLLEHQVKLADDGQRAELNRKMLEIAPDHVLEHFSLAGS